MKYSTNLFLTATASLLALLVPSQGAFCIPKDGFVFKVGTGAVSISILKKLWSIQVAFTIFSATSGDTNVYNPEVIHGINNCKENY